VKKCLGGKNTGLVLKHHLFRLDLIDNLWFVGNGKLNIVV
jgi:hypothetical protein